MTIHFSRTLLFLLAIIAVTVAVVVYVFKVPYYSSLPHEDQVALLSIQSETADVRHAIAEAIKSRRPVEQSSEIASARKATSKKFVEDMVVLSDGTLALIAKIPRTNESAAQRVWIWLMPQMKSTGDVEWICVGYPKGLLPMQCL